jgi:hypothetical protein
MIVHSLLSGFVGGMMSLPTKPGNFPMTRSLCAFQAVNWASIPGRSLTVAMMIAGVLMICFLRGC